MFGPLAFWLFVDLIDSGRQYAYSQKDKELKHREVLQNSSPSTSVHFQKNHNYNGNILFNRTVFKQGRGRDNTHYQSLTSGGVTQW
uniref:Uncharacterized protein n=1 Tax=Vespula pensylvanica TaxID=30213 RepID=A0A834PAY1_VESPE|nr:hypothetical protein H0235_002937 [Vespula pensylvanica]